MAAVPDTSWWWPMGLATAAGLSTTLGALVAVIRKPTHQTLALLLGVALGVMATVSTVELLVKNALESADAFSVVASSVAGGLAYYLLEPFFPRIEEAHVDVKADTSASTDDSHHQVQQDTEQRGSAPNSASPAVPRKHAATRKAGESSLSSSQQQQQQQQDVASELAQHDHHHGLTVLAERAAKLSAARMLRLGVLMAVTMTLHNLPEGFAVAFSAFTDIGPVMAVAIAMHNIPEGIIVAAPIYAATGSRWKAVGVATASGLSEPLGAFLALVLLHRLFTPDRLHYLLAFVGGVMLAVCAIELWPEGRRCKHDRHFGVGIVIGSIIMGWTLSVEG